MNNDLKHYLIAVEHPNVSGFEHLEMLCVRDRLVEQETRLTAKEKAQLAAADQRLLEQANAFYNELARITDLNYERQQRQPSPEQWWWYLDILRHLPTPSPQAHSPELAT